MNAIHETLAALIQYPSITPDDAGCQAYMINFLSQLGFHCQELNQSPVSNFFARLGEGSPLLVFAGHTDVVPAGNLAQWNTAPFELHEKEGILYGRGTADMKGSLACMMIAAKRFVHQYPQFKGSLGFLITSGEEGDEYMHGTPYVMAELQKQGIRPDYCLVGEPSSSQRVGDVIKIGRRGSLGAKLVLHGKQGHVAYPQLADNPIHRLSPVLTELIATRWDKGNEHFPPTSLQFTHIQAGGQASNIIPGDIALHFNFRYSTEQTADALKKAVIDCFTRHGLHPQIEWQHSGEPFLTAKGAFIDHCVQIIQDQTGHKPELSTSGGTSDGRFIAPYGVEVIELGPVNQTIHQINECVCLSDLETLTSIYYLLLEKVLR